MSTLKMLNLPESELRRAKSVVPGENRADLIVGSKSRQAESVKDDVSTDGTDRVDGTQVFENKLGGKAESLLSSETKRSFRKAPSRASELSRLDIHIRSDQFELLTNLEHQFRKRDIRDERLTKANIIRALIDVLSEIKINPRDISDEKKLREHLLIKMGVKKSEE